MNQRTRQITDGAMRVFSRYGFAKTTMNDIAREAGVARQTLYNVYAGKDEVLRAAIKDNLSTTFDAVIDAWAQADDFGQTLDIFFEYGPLDWYDKVRSSPEMADMVDGLHRVAQEELGTFGIRCVDALAVELAPYAARIEENGATVQAMAEFVFSTGMNAKYNAPNRDTLVQRLSVLKFSVLAMIGTANI